jgi:uncharacterized protein YjiS (DUF1127 family)
MSFQSRNRFFTPPDYYASSTVPRPSLGRRIALVLAVWRQRREMRRQLALMDARCLRELGISPAAAAYESGKPFWRSIGCLR